MCCVRLHSDNSEPTMLISQKTPDEHPPPSPCRWPALIALSTLAKFQLVWRSLRDVLFRSYCLFEHTLTAVCALPEYRSCRKFNAYSTILSPSNGPLYFQPDRLVRFEVRLELYAANARLVVSPPSLFVSVSPPDATAKPMMASSHHFTPLRQVSARLAPLV